MDLKLTRVEIETIRKTSDYLAGATFSHICSMPFPSDDVPFAEEPGRYMLDSSPIRAVSVDEIVRANCGKVTASDFRKNAESLLLLKGLAEKVTSRIVGGVREHGSFYRFTGIGSDLHDELNNDSG